jgi:multidrug resistance efflux pump
LNTTLQSLSEALRSAAAQLSTASARAGAEADALRRRAEEAEAQLSTARAAVDQLQRVRTVSVLLIPVFHELALS